MIFRHTLQRAAQRLSDLNYWPNVQRAVIYPSPESLIQEPGLPVLMERDREQNILVIRWMLVAARVTIYIGHSPDDIDTTTPAAVIHNQTYARLSVDNAAPYFALLIFEGRNIEQQVFVLGERDLRLEGTVNFRDIGGYPTQDGQMVRWGLVYRAGNLAQLTPFDWDMLTRRNIRLVCDLRTEEEIEEEPDHLPGHIDHALFPVHTDEPVAKQIRSLLRYRNRMDVAMIDAYTRLMVDRNAAVFASVFQRIAAPGHLPIVFHCTAGKDRTGITAALLLALLGVKEELILADYSLSNRYFDVFEGIGRKAIRPLRHFGITTGTIQPLFTANPRTLQATFAHIRSTYGSVENYLIRTAGLSDDVLHSIRANLLTDKDSSNRFIG